MKKVEVKSKEYVQSILVDGLVFRTLSLGEEIAVCVFSKTLGKVGLARQLDKENLIEFFKDINPSNISERSLFEVRLIGGQDTDNTKNSIKELIENLQAIDGGKDIIDIKAFDVGVNLHSDSFEMNCYHGGVYPVI